MTDDTHGRWREQLGAYVLGGLSDEEAEEVRTHLRGCARCRAEHADLAPLAAALRDVDPRRIGEEAQPRPELADRVALRVEGQRRRRSRETTRRWSLTGAATAAAAGFAVVLALAIFPLGGGDTPPAPAQEPIEVVEAVAGVQAEGALIPHTWGTELVLTATGLQDGVTYDVAFQRGDGTSVSSGTFIGDATKPVVCRLNAALLRDDAEGLTVTRAGEVVLTSEL